MRNGSAGCCPPRFVASRHLPKTTTARAATTHSRTIRQRRLVRRLIYSPSHQSESARGLKRKPPDRFAAFQPQGNRLVGYAA